MRKSRKFKKAEQEFTNNTKTFDQFCLENGIEVENRNKNKTVKRKVWISISAACATAAIIVCCFIPLMRQNTNAPETYYGDNNVGHMAVDHELPRDTYKLFKEDKAIYTRIDRVYANENETLTLGYMINNVLYGEFVEDKPIAFEFDYLICVNSYYKFNNIEKFRNLPLQYVQDGITFSYGIADSDSGLNAYITFRYDKNDYYIRLWEYENMTELNNENIETFIRLAF